jgi:hypothetical protein
MNKRIVVAIIVLMLVPVWASATSIGIGAGIDPTGIIMVGTTTETLFLEHFGLRVQIGIAVNSGINGLMTMNGIACGYYPVFPFMPFVGLGAGVALTPSGYNGWTIDSLAGTHIFIAPPVSAFLDLHYVVRFSSSAITYGPIFEGGVSFSF